MRSCRVSPPGDSVTLSQLELPLGARSHAIFNTLKQGAPMTWSNFGSAAGLFAPQKLIPLLRAAKDLSQEGNGWQGMVGPWWKVEIASATA